MNTAKFQTLLIILVSFGAGILLTTIVTMAMSLDGVDDDHMKHNEHNEVVEIDTVQFDMEKVHHHDDHNDHSDHEHHSHATREAADPENAPTVTSLSVWQDPDKGWNLSFATDNFTFTPDYVGGEHVANEGHAHLYVNGEKLARLYSTDYHIESLPQGENTIRVSLNTNKHDEYVVDGQSTGRETVVIVQ